MNLIRRLAFFLFALPLLATSAEPLPDGLYAEVTTERGVIIAEIYFQKAPMTAASFVGLAEGTLGPAPRKPFYDGLKFHRVVPGFVVQGGDPNGTGSGDAGYSYPDEIIPGVRFDKPGVMLLANSGPDTNGSQFCFILSPQPRLNYAYPAFGQVVRGLEVLPLIKQGDTMKVKILRIGKAAKAFRADEKTFAQLVARAPRLPLHYFEDADSIAAGEQPWHLGNLETKLANVSRFLGAQFYVRLFEKFEPSFPGQTPQQFVDAYHAKYRIPAKATMAAYFSDNDQWLLATGSPASLKLPDYKRRAGKPPAADRADDVKKEKIRVYYSALEIINGITFQLEPLAPGRK
jgi:cyclophilin family peptidyl-prolyl cis-trans isomerase